MLGSDDVGSTVYVSVLLTMYEMRWILCNCCWRTSIFERWMPMHHEWRNFVRIVSSIHIHSSSPPIHYTIHIGGDIVSIWARRKEFFFSSFHWICNSTFYDIHHTSYTRLLSCKNPFSKYEFFERKNKSERRNSRKKYLHREQLNISQSLASTQSVQLLYIDECRIKFEKRYPHRGRQDYMKLKICFFFLLFYTLGESSKVSESAKNEWIHTFIIREQIDIRCCGQSHVRNLCLMYVGFYVSLNSIAHFAVMHRLNI